MKMDISSQNEGKIYLPSPPYTGNDGYVPPSMRTVDSPSAAWSSTTAQSPPAQPAQVDSYDVSHHEGSYPKYVYAPPQPDPSTIERRIFGLRRTTFILSAIIGVLVLALALGLGIGLGVGRNNQNNGQDGTSLGANQANTTESVATTSSKPTTTTTSLDAQDDKPTPTQTKTISQLVTVTSLPKVLPLDCPSPASQTQTITLQGPDEKPMTTFSLKCGKDNVGFDMLNTLAYSLEDCMRACAMYNHFSKPLQCAGVQFWKNIEDATRMWDGNCFLKSEVAKTLGNKPAGDTVWAEVV